MAKIEQKHDEIGIIRLMARAENYVMVRRPAAYPFIMHGRDWDRLPDPDPSVSAPTPGEPE